MSAKCKKNRIFGACILLMMAVLAVCTVAFAEEGSDSYSLVIKKEFDFKLVESDSEITDADKEKVKEEAENQQYTFKITGTRIDGNETKTVNETVTLPREEDGKKVWYSQTYKSNGPFNVTVTEITDNIDIEDGNGNHYNMSDSTSDTRVLVNSRKHELQLRNNATLTIQRPADDGSSNNSKALWYRVTNRPFDGHSDSGFESVDMVFSLEAGVEKKIDNLRAAIYTIEQIAAPDGYQLQMGTREETVTVSSGQKGEGYFYINGTPGMLTLTAGGTKGDGATHYYEIDRTDKDTGDDSEFVPRTVPIASGETYVLQNLPRGKYAVTEYTIAAGEEFTVTMPQTDERTQSGKSSALTSGTANSWKYMDLNDSKFDVDYIRMVSFGPLYNGNGNSLNSTTSYAVFRYATLSEDGKYITNIRTHSTGYTGNRIVSVANAPEIRMVNSNKRLYFAVTGVKSTTAKTIGVKWIEYDEKETEKTFKNLGVAESVTVDRRKWIRIQAPALDNPNAAGADQIAYYYTLRDKNGNLIPGTTDKADTTVKLKPGSSTELQLPEAGSYTIVENVVGNTPVGFTMKVEGYPFGTTQADKSIVVQVGGKRSITISKSALVSPPKDSIDNRDYTFSVTGAGFSESVTIQAGESKTVTLPEAGQYTVSPVKDTLGAYDLNYRDSGAVYGTASGSTGTITFTNVFSRGDYGYRFIHEYYVREADGTYKHEGSSQITTRLGRNDEDEIHDAADIGYVPEFNSNHYVHFDEAYGWVDPIQSSQTQEETEEELSEEELLSDVIDEKDGKSGEGESEIPDESDADSDQKQETEGSGEDGSESDQKDGTETSDEENTDSDQEEETGTSGKDSVDADQKDEGDETEAPGEDSADADQKDEDDKAGTPGESSSDGGIEEEPEASGEENPSSGQESPASNQGEEPEPFNGGSLLSLRESRNGVSSEEAVLNLMAARVLDDSGQDKASDSSGENSPDSDGSEAPDDSDEDGSDSDGNEAPDDSDEDGPDSDGNEAPDDSYENDPDSKEDNDPEISDGDDFDANGEEETETPDKDVLDSNGDKALDSSGEDKSESDENGGQKSLNRDSSPEKTKRAFPDARFSPGEGTDDGSQPGNSYNDAGIIDQGSGKDSSAELTLKYGPDSDSGKNFIKVTKDASQIVILRYYRDRQPAGKYSVIHVYYFRDEEGDHWEGTSGVQLRDGELGVSYTGQNVEKICDFQPADAERPYLYTWDLRPQYGVVEQSDNMGSYDPDNSKFEFAGNGQVYRPDNAWTAVEGTEEGNQIIILRYYRELGKDGTYNIVHEYYSRTNSESQDSAADGVSQGDAENGESHDSVEEGRERGRAAVQSQSDDSETGEGEEVSDRFTGTLNRNDGFVYTFEGNRDPESVTAPLGTTHTAGEDDWKLAYKGNTYSYIDAGYGAMADAAGYSSNPNQQWAASTEEGDDVIILRYYREVHEADEPLSGVSYKVVHEYYVRDEEGVQTLVGTSEIGEAADAAPNVHYTQEDIRKEPVFQGDTYTYFDWGCGTVSGQSYSQIAGKQYVEATESGDQIIILRYYRQPDHPQPQPEASPGHDENDEQEEESGDSENGIGNGGETSKASKASAGSVKQQPASGSTYSAEIIGQEGGSSPRTGDDSRIALWATLAIGAMCGLVIVRRIYRKRKDK